MVVKSLAVALCVVLSGAAFAATALATPVEDAVVHLAPAPTSVDHASCVAPTKETQAIAPSAGGTVVAFTLVWSEPSC